MNHNIQFTLRQHTPLIHFQYDQPGTTLRATELKPKLDRFLIKKVFKNEWQRYREFLIGFNIAQKRAKRYNREVLKSDFTHIALDYSVKIVPSGKKEISLPNKSLFFANNTLAENKKIKAIKYKEIKIEIGSLHRELIERIEKNKELFFAMHNFGTRQSKGFGGFYPENPNISFERALLQAFPNVYKLTTRSNPFKTVDYTHKLLKSGINFNGEYKKSLLFRYACTLEPPCRWEKKKIKEEFKEVLRDSYTSAVDCQNIKDENYRYIRAVFGVAGFYEFNGGPKRGGERIDISHSVVKRFKSPLLYKVYQNEVYLVFDKSYKKLLEQEGNYRFKLIIPQKKSFSISTFEKNQFDMERFFDFVLRQKDGKRILQKVQP